MNISTKKKKNMTIILSLVLVAAIALGITLAYLFTKTETETNVFTFGDNIRANLDEPSWDPDDALDLVPGSEVDKDPQITNTSNNGLSEYVGIKLVFTDGEGKPLSDTATAANSVAKLLSLIDIDWNTTDWQLANSAMAGCVTQVWIYKNELAPGETTEPIFTTVKIKDTISPNDLLWLRGFYDHGNSCYDIGACACDVTYKHHKNCNLFGLTGADAVGKDGTLGGKICNCSPGVIHENDCASLGVLKSNCGCVLEGLGGFKIVIDGGAVQYDAFGTMTEAITALLSLLV